MESFEVSLQEGGAGVPSVRFTGYLGKEGGEKLLATIVPILKSGKTGIVIDLVDCKVISSPGIAALWDILMIVTDDYKGKVVLSGLDKSKTMFLKIAGVLPLAQTAETVEAGCKLLS